VTAFGWITLVRHNDKRRLKPEASRAKPGPIGHKRQGEVVDQSAALTTVRGPRSGPVLTTADEAVRMIRQRQGDKTTSGSMATRATGGWAASTTTTANTSDPREGRRRC